MPNNPEQAQGSGAVTGIDMATGNITLDHDPITKLKRLATKIGFSVKPDLLAGPLLLRAQLAYLCVDQFLQRPLVASSGELGR